MINVDVTEIETLDQARIIIKRLVNGLNNCPAADFSICRRCGAIYTKGWICPVCSHDNSSLN